MLLNILTFPVPIPDEVRKLTKFFNTTFLCAASKGYMKAFKAPFEASQRSVEIKF